MKVIRKFKRTVGTCLFASMVFNCITPTLFAAVRSVMMQQDQPEYLDAQEDGLQLLIMEIVNQAIAVDAEHEPSPALMRCYERIIGGYQTLPVNDVMEAMPEMLGYALMKYERGMQPDVTRTVRVNAAPLWESVRAPRPGAPNPYEPSAPLGSVCIGAPCEGLADDLCQVLRLLHIIKKRIGTVNDPVCVNSVLGVLGNACEVFGPDSNISLKIAEILSNLAADTALLSAEISEVLYAVQELETTVTQCCDDLADDIFATQTILCCKLEDIKVTLTECCDDLADDIFDTKTLILECCKQTQSNFEFTWSIIEECCETIEDNFETTWSLIDACCSNNDSKLDTIIMLLQTILKEILE